MMSCHLIEKDCSLFFSCKIVSDDCCSSCQPERISNAKYGYKSDIWSLGLVILECAIGRFPYVPSEEEGWSNIYELLETIVNQPPPSATDEFSPEFRSFISSWYVKSSKRSKSYHFLLLQVHMCIAESEIAIGSYLK